MPFRPMVWIVAHALRVNTEKLVHNGAHHTQFPMDRLQSFVDGVSRSDGPWGEPLLTEESGPLYSSIQSIKQGDKRMLTALWQRLYPEPDDTAVLVQAVDEVSREKPSPLRPVIFNLRQSHGGRSVRPESVLELSDTDDVQQTGPGTPSMVVADRCSWQCGDQSA